VADDGRAGRLRRRHAAVGGVNLPDLVNARRLGAAGCTIAAAANAALVLAGGVSTLIVLRVVTGAALACVYPPGLKVAAGWFQARRGAALGILIGGLTVGSAFPHLLASASATIPWRAIILAASALALAGGAVVVTLAGDGPYVAKSAPFDRSAIARIFRDRRTRLATLGYLGHMWELYAAWTWIAVFASASIGRGTGATPSSPAGSAVAFVFIASGAIGSALTGWFADRIGHSRVASAAMVVSGVCCGASGLLFGAPAPLLVAFAMVWGVAVLADSAQLSALVAEVSPRDQVGTALTVQMCAGFVLTMASIRLVPLAAQMIGWRWVFICPVPGPVFGVAALRRLQPRSAASGRALLLRPPRRLSGTR
jgi:MFS family permease